MKQASSKSNHRSKSKLFWAAISLCALAAFFLILRTEENWRGERAWDDYKQKLIASGFAPDWESYVPPPVPAELNFFAAPKMQEWFVRHPNSGTNELSALFENRHRLMTLITNESQAVEFLAWSDQFRPQLDLIRQAVQRPLARMDGDYRFPVGAPVPHAAIWSCVAQTLAQRARCHLLLGQSQTALEEVRLLRECSRSFSSAPTGKPMTLVAAMVNVAFAGMYVDILTEGFDRHAWTEPQLAALQNQLAGVDLMPAVAEAMRESAVVACRTAENVPLPSLLFQEPLRQTVWCRCVSWLWPRGWTYQNMINVMQWELKPLSGYDSKACTLSPPVFDAAHRDFGEFMSRRSPYKILAAIVVPDFTPAWMTAGYQQTRINQAGIVCALERC